jgi:hypothetical protein
MDNAGIPAQKGNRIVARLIGQVMGAGGLNIKPPKGIDYGSGSSSRTR